MAVEDEGAGAGHRYQRLVIVNGGPAPCTVEGHPQVSVVAADGSPAGAAVAEEVPSAPVLLAPGAVASAVVAERSVDVYGPDRCGGRVAVTALVVRLPGDPASWTVPTSGEACRSDVGQFSVRPWQAGRGGPS